MIAFTDDELFDNGVSIKVVNRYKSEDETVKHNAEKDIFFHFLSYIINEIPIDLIMCEFFNLDTIDDITKDLVPARILENKFPGYDHERFLFIYIYMKQSEEFLNKLGSYGIDIKQPEFNANIAGVVEDEDMKDYLKYSYRKFHKKSLVL